MGQPSIVRLLKDVPGISDYSVQGQLANLKPSGDYGRIVADVAAEIAARAPPRG